MRFMQYRERLVELSIQSGLRPFESTDFAV